MPESKTLEKYKQKRDRSKTPEPFAGEPKEKDVLRFTIQKHAATRLHYDLRLEMAGVLKSWAVPKGPSTDPEIKRLAMMVEDHPFDYRDFEGIIPKGEYGGGTVIVWDEGTYEASPLEGKTKKEQEKYLLKSLNEGTLKITFHGKKLKGEYALFKIKANEENTWLLVKHKDKYASKTDITLKDKSVQSGKTIEKVKATSKNIYNTTDKKTKKTGIETENESPKPLSEKIKAFLEKSPDTKMPTSVKPMLATLVDEPFDDPDWLFEVKWDGYRSIGLINKGNVQLLSRNNKSFTEKYYPITESLREWKFDAVIDGELIVLRENGSSDFEAQQNWRSESDGELVMYVFDLLWYNGKSLFNLSLTERQAILEEILPDNDNNIRISQSFPGNGKEFFETAGKLGLEGMIAKKANSIYTPDIRSKNWLKIKVHKRQEVVIGGYTLNEGAAKFFSSLLLGVYEGGTLKFVGKVGTGFSEKLKKEMLEQFKPLVINKSPFHTEPDVNEPSRFRPNPPKAIAVWLNPEIICEVSYAEVTKDGVFRHPSFKGLRTDKKADEVTREKELKTVAIVESDEKENSQDSGLIKKRTGVTERKTLLNPTEETQVKKINGHELKFTNLSKLYWPEDNISKRDMINYYYQVAEFIVPYLKDRPQSLNRFPNGIHGTSFYQKNVKGKSPDWVKTFPYTTSDSETKEFLVGADEATLLWMASLGSIEMNPWFSRVQSEDYPDFCIIDLDPDKNTFDQVIEAALEVKKLLDQLGAPSYPKTSGSTGIHIYIPLAAKYTYDQSQMFAKLIVQLVHNRIPGYTSTERMIKNRGGKMYLDFLQNRPGATIASPYSVRPKPGAPVSMPLHWDEVKKGMKTENFTLRNSIARLKIVGDLFKGVLGKGIDMEKILSAVHRIES